MLQNQTHFCNAFTFDCLLARVTLHEAVKLGVNICSMVIRLTRYASSEPNSAILFAGIVASVSSLSLIVTPLVRSTCCPVRPENSINFESEVRWSGSSRIQIIATHYITSMLQFKLLIIWLCLYTVAGYLGHLCFVCTYKLRSYRNYEAASAVRKNDSLFCYQSFWIHSILHLRYRRSFM
jgi:hypothetical protein